MPSDCYTVGISFSLLLNADLVLIELLLVDLDQTMQHTIVKMHNIWRSTNWRRLLIEVLRETAETCPCSPNGYMGWL